jgi:hypothetical protein
MTQQPMAQQRQRHTTDPEVPETRSAPPVELAAEALLTGMTRAQVIAQLVSRMRHDQGYLAYRKACHRHTRSDEP